MRTPRTIPAAAAAALFALLGAAGGASAQTLCKDLPNPVYVQAGDTQEPLLKDLGKRLRDSTNPDQALTLIYVPTGSCTNVDAIYKGTPITVNPRYIPSKEQDPAWTPAMASPTCTIEAGGRLIDLANSNVLIDQCTADPTPAGIEVHQGAIQSYVFAVPAASSQIAITAEEAYFVFGFGAAGLVTPWTDETLLFIRTVTKSTLLSVAANIHVPAAKWKGKRFDQSTDVVNNLASSGTPEKAVGILGGEVYDANRATLKVLAYRAYKQKHAYFPDSTATSFDKQNLRDGHYTIWSPTLWLARSDTLAEKPRARLLLDLILGNAVTPDPGFKGIDVQIAKGLVPQCAMKVTRSVEGGPLSLYSAPEPCGCYFESKVGTSGSSCTVCTDNGPCGAGKCRLGFCEAR